MSSERCNGCAFTEGSEANLEPDNNIRGIICLLTPKPFYCHDSFDWKDPALNQPVKIADLPDTRKICQGWREKVGELAQTGYYKDEPKKTKNHGTISAMTLETILRCEDENEKKALWELFREALGFLGKKWKKYQNKSIEVQEAQKCEK